MRAPAISCRSSKTISRYLPKRDELSFRVVLALPKASMTGLVARIARSVSLMTCDPGRLEDILSGSSTVAKYRMIYLADIVLPAPLSPLTTIV